MAKEKKSILVPDKKGMWWDLALYVPTVIFLLSIGFQMWYTSDRNWSYPIVFMATFFFLTGATRILKTRMMILPSAAISIDANKQRIVMQLRSGVASELVKGVRYFPDMVGKSFALTGFDLSGKKQQFVFHKGQFESEAEFKDMRDFLRVYG